MNVNFMDVCHIRVKGNDIYKGTVDELISTYKRKRLVNGIAKMAKRHTPKLLCGMGIVMTANSMHRKAMEDEIRVLRALNEYKRKIMGE